MLKKTIDCKKAMIHNYYRILLPLTYPCSYQTYILLLALVSISHTQSPKSRRGFPLLARMLSISITRSLFLFLGKIAFLLLQFLISSAYLATPSSYMRLSSSVLLSTTPVLSMRFPCYLSNLRSSGRRGSVVLALKLLSDPEHCIVSSLLHIYWSSLGLGSTSLNITGWILKLDTLRYLSQIGISIPKILTCFPRQNNTL